MPQQGTMHRAPTERNYFWEQQLVNYSASRLLKNVFSVILNEVKDLYLVEKNRFFATLRMTNMVFLNFSTAS